MFKCDKCGCEHNSRTVCPKCGAPMIKRTAARGKNAGKEFFGCSKFPACRAIVEINGNVEEIENHEK